MLKDFYFRRQDPGTQILLLLLLYYYYYIADITTVYNSLNLSLQTYKIDNAYL